MALTKVTSSLTDLDGGITIDNITIDGTEIDLSSGSLTIDVADNIVLDTDGGNIALKDAGTQWGNFANNGGDFEIDSLVQDKDIKFNGNDGGSTITAGFFDMSDGGKLQIGASTVANLNMGRNSDVIEIKAKKDGTDAIPLTFHTQASGGTTGERMRVQASGNVSIGSTTADSMRLNIDAGGTHGIFVDDIGTGYDGIQIRGSNTTGSFFALSFKRSNNTLVGYILAEASTTSFVSGSSDLSLKENIVDWNENVLDKFKDIKPVTFNFISDETKETKKGYIAQNEVDKFPEAYPKNPHDEKYSFNPSGMVTYLMKAIQELSAKVEELESKINE